MVKKTESSNCKICGKSGYLYFEEKYSNQKFTKFFEEFYGVKFLRDINDFLKEQNYTLLKCLECNFIWQKFIPNSNFSNFLYEEVIDKNFSLNKSINLEKNSRRKSVYKFNAIINYLNIKKINVLDFGAGWGSWLINLDKNKVNKYAYEISPSRKSYLSSNQIDVLDDDNIQKYKNYFDYIRLEQVLEHIPDLNNCMKLIKSISKKGCILEVGVPNGINQIKNVNSIVITKGPIQPLEHLNCFSNKSLKKLIMKYGFRPFNFKDILVLYFNKSIFTFTGLKILVREIFENFFSTTIKFKSNT